MKHIIEKGLPSDIDALEAFYDELTDYLETHINYPGWKRGIYPDRETAETGVHEGTLYVVRDGSRIAGTVILRHVPEEAYSGANWGNELSYDDIIVIYTLAVHPDYLGKGVGREIMTFVVETARRTQMKAIRLDVYEKNIPAISLYRGFGFEYIGNVDLGYSGFGLDSFQLYQKVL